MGCGSSAVKDDTDPKPIIPQQIVPMNRNDIQQNQNVEKEVKQEIEEKEQINQKRELPDEAQEEITNYKNNVQSNKPNKDEHQEKSKKQENIVKQEQSNQNDSQEKPKENNLNPKEEYNLQAPSNKVSTIKQENDFSNANTKNLDMNLNFKDKVTTISKPNNSDKSRQINFNNFNNMYDGNFMNMQKMFEEQQKKF